LATARALAAALRRAKFDLILLGKYSLDAETGQVGPEVAELMGIAQITGVRKLEIDGRAVKAERESDEGFEEVEASMPALLTCAERVAAPIKVKADEAERAKSRASKRVSAEGPRCRSRAIRLGRISHLGRRDSRGRDAGYQVQIHRCVGSRTRGG